MEACFLTIFTALFIGCVDVSMSLGTNQLKHRVVSRIAYMPIVETVPCTEYSIITATSDCLALKMALPTDRTIVGQSTDQIRFLNENAKLLLEPPIPLTTNGSGKSQVVVGIPSLHSERYKVVIDVGNIDQVVQITLNDDDRILALDADNRYSQVKMSEKLKTGTVIKAGRHSVGPLNASVHTISIGIGETWYAVRIDDGEELTLSSNRTVAKTGSVWFNVLSGNSYSLYRVEFQVIYKTDCSDLSNYLSENGIYTIYPDGTHRSSVDVYCQFDSNGQGWTVIQRRIDGSVNFYRGWDEYKTGFGSADGEYWIGNDAIHELTSDDQHGLLIVMSDFEGVSQHARYSIFKVGDESSGYKLSVGGYSGTAGDSLATHDGCRFSTFDKDLDAWSGNCAQKYNAAWWYKDCHHSNLNGRYLKGNHTSFANGVNWFAWHGHYYSLKATTMMVRKL